MKKALLVIDIQNDYFENGAMELVGALEASEKAQAILTQFRNKKLPIIHIQHIGIAATATFFKPNTSGAEIHTNVRPLEDEKTIIKFFPNSFRETDLNAYLQGHGIAHLTIVGMMTHMCIDATVRAAKDLGYTSTLIEDACATRALEINGKKVAAEDVQTAFLAALSPFYATIQSSTEHAV